MKRVLVLGGSGMFGHKLAEVLSRQMQTFATFRNRVPLEFLLSAPDCSVVRNVDANDPASIERAVDYSIPDVIVNAIGVVKQRDVSNDEFRDINLLFPQWLSVLCRNRNIRLIHLSTDCVFSGTRGNYREFDYPDAEDVYGVSKFTGEVAEHGALTLRTSIVGWQRNGTESLLSWLATHRNQTINGYRNVLFSGLSSPVLARFTSTLITDFPFLSGLFHVSGEKISKFDLLTRLCKHMGWDDVRINSVDAPVCDRSLDDTRIQLTTRWRPPAWDFMLDELAHEYPRYSEFYEGDENR